MIGSILYNFSIFSVFLPLIIGIIKVKDLEANARLVLLIVAFASIPHIATVLNNVKSIPVFYYNSYIIVDAFFWPLVFWKIQKNQKSRKLYLLLLVFNILIVFIGVLYLGFTRNFAYQLVCINSIFQVIFVAIYFYDLSSFRQYLSLILIPTFWFSIGLLFYAPTTFFLFLFYDRINKLVVSSELNYLWELHNFFNTFMYLMFSIGFVISKRK